jgi:muramoyltetrapeptide carboxypeptidase LdcA involved in peptidoglycan recycling
MDKIFPKKLGKGSRVRVIATSFSFQLLSADVVWIANERLANLGFEVTFGKHLIEDNEYRSSSVDSRLEDFHDAFSNKDVDAVFVALGGFNSNQLLSHIDWELVRANPKVFCGYSDVSALNYAIHAKTGLVNYYGPNYSTFGQKLYFDYTAEYFEKCLLSDNAFDILPASHWSDDLWYMNQEERVLIPNDGFVVIHEGEVSGQIMGGNLSTINLLQGTDYWPLLTEETVLFLEEDELSNPNIFDRYLQSLIHQYDFNMVKGIVIGRFQKASNVSVVDLMRIIDGKKELESIPVIANADFGHTSPIVTFPIGGKCFLKVAKNGSVLRIMEH